MLNWLKPKEIELPTRATDKGVLMWTEELVLPFGLTLKEAGETTSIFNLPRNQGWECVTGEMIITMINPMYEVVFRRQGDFWIFESHRVRAIWLPLQLRLGHEAQSVPMTQQQVLEFLQRHQLKLLEARGNMAQFEVNKLWQIVGDRELGESSRALDANGFRLEFECDGGRWFMRIVGRQVN